MTSDCILSVSDGLGALCSPHKNPADTGRCSEPSWETVRGIFSAHNYCLSPRWQTEFIQRSFYANKISSEMQIFIVFLSRVNLSIFLSDFLFAQPSSRKIVGTMFINCVPFQLILSFGIIIFNLKCCDTVYQLKMFRFKTELDSELKSKTASTNIVVIKVIINGALMDGDIRKKSRCHIFQPLLWQIKF